MSCTGSKLYVLNWQYDSPITRKEGVGNRPFYFMLDTYRYRVKKNGDVTPKLFDSALTIPKDWHESPRAAKAAKELPKKKTIKESAIDLLTAKVLEQGTLEITEDDNSTGNNQ